MLFVLIYFFDQCKILSQKISMMCVNALLKDIQWACWSRDGHVDGTTMFVCVLATVIHWVASHKKWLDQGSSLCL